MKVAKIVWPTIGVISVFFLLIVGLIISGSSGSDNSGCEVNPTEESATNLAGANTGSWADKNSAQYQAAKTIWETLEKDKGKK